MWANNAKIVALAKQDTRLMQGTQKQIAFNLPFTDHILTSESEADCISIVSRFRDRVRLPFADTV
jgi:hypothetical protein